MQFREIFSIGILLTLSFSVRSQSAVYGQFTGTVISVSKEALTGISVRIEGTSQGTITDNDGHFVLKNISAGQQVLLVSGLGYQPQKKTILVTAGKTFKISFTLAQLAQQMQQVDITGQSELKNVRQQAFNVDAIDAVKVQNRNVDMNRLLDRTMGVRVRETGGMGSDFNYSIHGLSGKAIKFFIDGIPMESFGSSYSINNLPINLVERIEVYKGVTPVELGSDALGGAINVITNQNINSYLDASYSYGSFNTHRAAVSGRWKDAKSGFTTTANVFHNYSDNNYKVWGPTVEVADVSGRPVPVVARRFNDHYRSSTAQLETGFTNVAWANQLLLGLTYSNLDKGIQTGQTMAYVFGEASYHESFVMPSLKYSKKDLFVKGLNMDAFASLNRVRATTVDTSSRRYNWKGEVIEIAKGGEIGGIGAQKSMLTFTDRTQLHRLNASYKLSDFHSFNFNYNYTSTTRKGTDPLAAQWTIPYRLPQDFTKQISGLSYQSNAAQDRWINTFFVKNYNYLAHAQGLTNQNSGADPLAIEIQSKSSQWGYGYATRFTVSQNILLKLSAEKAIRLPEAIEVLGNGNTILNSPDLHPENSYNANLGVQLSKAIRDNRFAFQTSLFYRKTNDLILLAPANYLGRSNYENIAKTEGKGVEAELRYRRKSWLEFTGNITFQDIRNNQKYDPQSGSKSIVYRDRLRNTPLLMSNGEVRFNKAKLFRDDANASFYWNASYVHQYYLNWPSLGAKDTKSVIPMQFVQDIGLSYSFYNSKYNLSLECRNLFDKQVFDNYLLQKPGRSFSIKARYFITR
ncbi:TonB-dependent receptor [Dyadobacter subterraneus]|uniref:TonB-dependent receptor n=1 Tax=Dyadobacter subterraneus TaxID=2773304 RepID=A0ABR9WM51_9BACT|nr:TonB-dependent receptor [Dyadobacter subterraneus]MBE9466602.1 TonB-dependent receptor [Dyadobacter subterraneus]